MQRGGSRSDVDSAWTYLSCSCSFHGGLVSKGSVPACPRGTALSVLFSPLGAIPRPTRVGYFSVPAAHICA